MKKRLCFALSLVMILLTLLSPMACWGAPVKSDTKAKQEVSQTEKSEKSQAQSKENDKEKVENEVSAEAGKVEENQKAKGYYRNGKFVPLSSFEPGEISIAFTNDLHSHLDEFSISSSGNKIGGGFARMATIFQEISPLYKEDTFVLDTGDFSMGTAYQAIFEEEAAELRMMGYLGFDAVTLGNHEFDYGPEGLANMLLRARAYEKSQNKDAKEDSEYKLPKLTIANIDWKKTKGEKEYKKGAETLQNAFDKCKVDEDYIVLEKNEVKIAVFGLFGKDSEDCAPNSGTYFKDYVDTAKKTVKKIKKKEDDVKLIVCISHCGTNKDKAKSEDEILAKQVPGINLILSGHSHEKIKEPVKVGKTLIVSTGCYGKYVGHLTYKPSEKTGKYKLEAYNLIKSDEDVIPDKDTEEQIEGFKNLVNSSYFGKYGYTADKVIAKNKIKFKPIEEFDVKQEEEPYGNLLADAYVYAVNKAGGKDQDPVDVAIVPQGVVRDVLPTGDIRVSDAYNVLALGKGADGTSGYPLISVYLTGKELKNVAEVDATVSDDMIYTRLSMSGLSYKINKKRMKLNRAFDIQLGNGKDLKKISNKQLYRVVSDMYTASMLGLVNEKSKGLLELVPKNKDGSVITDFSKNIIKKGDSELKAWYAVALYLDKMGTVSSSYEKPDGRKIISTSNSLWERICQPNKLGWLIRLAIIIPLVIILLVLVFILIRKGRRRKRGLYTLSERQKKAIFAPPKKQKNLFAGGERRGRRNRRF